MPMQPRPMAETSRLLFPSLRFCIIFSFVFMPRFACRSFFLARRSLRLRLVMFPRNSPVFIGPSRADDEAAVPGESINAWKVLTDKQVACNRSLHMMGQPVRSFIQIIAPEGSLITIVDVLIG